MRMHRKLFKYTPSEKVTVVLVDNSDFGNAGVTGSPRNTMVVQIAPSSFVFETGPANERINFLMNHELTHVVTLDQAIGRDVFFRRLFRGKVRETSEHPETVLYGFLTMPRRAAPRWHREGTAVFMETWMSGGLGRAQGPYDEMVFRAMVRDSTRFYDPLGLESAGAKVDFQIGVNSYLYGTRFTTWLADKYGPQAVIDWVSRRPGSRPYFANQFANVFHRHLRDAWHSWVADEQTFQRANLDSVRRYPTTPSRDLSPQPLGSVSPSAYDPVTRTVYAGVFYPGAVAHIAAIPLDGSGPRFVREIEGAALYSVCSIAWDPARRRVFYTKDDNEWRDLCELDPVTGRAHTLIRDARIGDLAYDRADSSLWAVRHFNGISTVVRLFPPYRDWSLMCAFPYGRDIYDIDVSPDGKSLVASVAEISGRQTLRLFPVETLLARGHHIEARYTTSARPFPPTSSSRRTAATSTAAATTRASPTSFAGTWPPIRSTWSPTPKPASSGRCRSAATRCMVYRFAGGGFVPVLLRGEDPARRERDHLLRPEGDRAPSRAPVLEGAAAEQRRARLADPLRRALPPAAQRPPRRDLPDRRVLPRSRHGRTAGAFPGPGQRARPRDQRLGRDRPPRLVAGRVHGTIGLQARGVGAAAMHNPASFYDLFGPTKTSRKGDGTRAEWSKHADPRPAAHARAKRSRRRLDRARSPARRAERERVVGIRQAVRVRDRAAGLEAALLASAAVENEKGWQWTAAGRENSVRFGARASLRGARSRSSKSPRRPACRCRRATPRRGCGWPGAGRPGTASEPFANFFFGGFGNNWVDRADPKRYRHAGGAARDHASTPSPAPTTTARSGT